MPKPRKPIESHVRDGTYRADRHGPLTDDLDTAAPPVKPADLTGDAAEVWDRLVGLLAGIVRESDGPYIAEACQWWAELRRIRAALAKMTPGKHGYGSLIGTAATCSKEVDRLLTRFGLTPVDRAKLRAESVVPVKAKVAVRPKTALDRKGKPK